MNQRIQELSKEAFEYALNQHPGSDEFQPIWTEKFAELLVRECVELFDGNEQSELGYRIGDRIYKHFGVK